MADEMLSALISGETNLGNVLGDVQDGLEDTAEAFYDAASAATETAASFNIAEEGAEDLRGALAGVTVDAAAASGALEGVEESTEDLRSTVVEGVGSLQVYQAALDNVPEAAIEAATANQLVASTADEAGDEFRGASRSVEDYTQNLGVLAGFSLATPDLKSQTASIQRTVTTAVATEGVAESTAALATVRKAVTAIPDSRTVSVDVDADTDALETTVAADTSGLQDIAIPDQSVDISTDAFEGLTETFESATADAHILSEGLEGVSGESAHAAAEAAGATAELDVLGDTSRRVTENVDGLGGSLSSLGDIAAMPDVGAVTPTLQTDEARENFDEFAEAIAALPGDVRIDTSVTGVEELAEDLEVAQRRTRGAYQALQNLQDSDVDIRGMVGAADGLEDLRDRLDDAGGEAATTARLLESLSGSAEDMTDSAIAGATGLADLEVATDDISRSALTASNAISEMGDETSDLAGDAIASASSMQFLAGRVDEASDEMTEAAATAGVLQGSLLALSGGGILSGLSDVSANVGGISTSLSSVAKAAAVALPMLGSLSAAAGGLALGGLGVGAALGGGMIGAGLYGLGEQVANRDPLDDIKTSAEGVEEIMANLKQQIGTIFEPLTNNPVFQNMARGAMSEVLQMASEFVVFVQRLAPALGGMADRLGAVFDAVRPSLWAEWEAVTKAFLPIIEQLLSGTLRALPGVISAMREEGLAVLPMLADFMGNLVPLIGPTIRLGTALLSITIPALSWLMKVMGPLMPIVSALADGIIMASQAFGAFYDAFSPLIDLLGTVAIGAIAVVGALSAISSVVSGALAIGKLVGAFVSLSSIIGGVTSALGTIASVVTTVGGAIVGAVAALNPLTLALIGVGIVALGIAAHFGYLDGVISGLKDTWDILVSALTGDAGPLKQAIVGIANTAVKAINNLIKKVNKLPGVNIGTLGQYEVKEAPSKKGKKGGKSPWPSLGGNARKAGVGKGKGRGGGQSSRPAASNPNAQPYRKEEVTVNIYGDNQNEARIKQLAKEAVREANRESRRRSGAGN